MMTNVIAYLHTTFAYQSAAMQLMAGQAGFDAQQLHLRESLPVKVPATNEWRLAAPPEGVTGTLVTSNYVYRFTGGKLLSIQYRGSLTRVADTDALQPAQIDADGAYQLARQYLTAIFVDVAGLESNYPHTVSQSAAHPQAPGHAAAPKAPAPRESSKSPAGAEAKRVSSRPGMTNSIPVRTTAPHTFRVTWGGGGHGSTGAPKPVQISVEILGATKQCVGLQIKNADWLKAAPLQVTNAAALLGPPPSPQQFVENLLGGHTAYETVAKPDEVQAYLLKAKIDDADTVVESAPLTVNAATAAVLSRLLIDFNTYNWLEDKGSIPNYVVKLRFTKGADSVDVLYAANASHLQATHDGSTAEKDCDPASAALAQAVNAIFNSSPRK